MNLPIKHQCCLHIETSQLICIANQLTGFDMRATLVFNGLTFVRSEIIRKSMVSDNFRVGIEVN